MKWSDEDLDLALRELREEDVPETFLAALRARVMTEVARPRAPWWRWSWAPALGLAVIAVMLWPRPEDVAPPPLLARTPDVPAAAWLKTEPRPMVAVKRASVPPRIEATETPGLVRLASSDPNVVILWSLENGEGDEE